MDAHDDLDELMARLPKRSPREVFEELTAARRAAAATLPELTTIPVPSYPYGWSMLDHPLGGTMRFACVLGCGWYHDENPAREAAIAPLVMPLDPEKADEALTAQAENRAAVFRARVEITIAEHFDQAHPGR
ncbi:hypothetical protein [Streptomyces sp. NWU339]|uniref:hypothetical protein n=1 Tax=Streptomyces sp. NWU339 TaxID=2185284 RepID=UPI0011B41FB8|nr:hypothetical protein [Streptomyces sp. NWU339]